MKTSIFTQLIGLGLSYLYTMTTCTTSQPWASLLPHSGAGQDQMPAGVDLRANGWSAMPRSFKKSLAHVDQNEGAELAVGLVTLPNSELASKTFEYAKAELPERTFNHSMRIVYYGM